MSPIVFIRGQWVNRVGYRSGLDYIGAVRVNGEVRRDLTMPLAATH